MTTETATQPPRVRQRTRALDVRPDAGNQTGTLMVTRTRYGSEPETALTQIHVPIFPVPPAHVSVRAKETINMGDFNNVSVEVSIMLPCLPEVSELDRVYQMASDTVERWMEHEIKRATDPSWERPPEGTSHG